MNKPIRVLLLDLSPVGKLGLTLERILRCSPGISYDVHNGSVDTWSADHFELRFSDVCIRSKPELIILILSSSMLHRSGELMELMGDKSMELPIMAFIEDESSPDTMVLMLKFGTVDMIPGQLTSINVLPLILWFFGCMRQVNVAARLLGRGVKSKQLVGRNVTFLQEIGKVPTLAKCSRCVLIIGEAGTGKELVAQKIHLLSSRASRPFVAANCGAIPAHLADGELFGHEDSPFSSIPSKSGLVHQAEGSTLFLDDIDHLPPSVQAKLFELLRHKTSLPRGAGAENHGDVRIIASASGDDGVAVRSGKLRQDLYSQLSSFSLRLPPLRERREDIPILTRHFLRKYSVELNGRLSVISPDAMEKLKLHHWPDNIRELEQVIERAVVLSDGGQIGADHIFLTGLSIAAEN